MRRASISTASFLASLTLSALADWRSDSGWNEFQEWTTLHSADLPNTALVVAGMTEAGTNYMINSADAQFSDIATITNVSGTSSGISSHANSVGSQFFGNTSSIAPDINGVLMHSVDDFVSKIQNSSTIWDMDIMSHAYVSTQTVPVGDLTILASAFDETTISDNILHIVGSNNGSSSNLPQIWSHTYNSITVGRSDGRHAAGTVTSSYPGAGRQKPELVAPLGTTSNSTGAVSSLAALLKAVGLEHTSSNAELPVVIKSCMLAGADKTPFPSWDNNTSRPIDEVYGAGEIDILNSFRILNAPEQNSGAIANYGWDYFTPGGRNRYPQSYTFTIPDSATTASLSANLSWNIGASIGSYSTLGNLSLTLTQTTTDPETEEDVETTIFTSDSSVDNLEHIWQPTLLPGDYTLTVDRNDNLNTRYALAWRINLETNVSPTSLVLGATENTLNFDSLFANHSYTIQRSNNLTNWTTLTTVTADSNGDLTYNDPSAALGEEVFYRLRYFSP